MSNMLHKEKSYCYNQVYTNELRAFKPVTTPISREIIHNQHRKYDSKDLKWGKHQRKTKVEHLAYKHQDGDNKQGDLDRTAQTDLDRDIEFIF